MFALLTFQNFFTLVPLDRRDGLSLATLASQADQFSLVYRTQYIARDEIYFFVFLGDSYVIGSNWNRKNNHMYRFIVEIERKYEKTV